MQSSSFVHISREEEVAKHQDSEEDCVDAIALHTLANCLCRSSPEVVVAQVEEQLHLPGEGDDMELQESEEGNPVKVWRNYR